MTPECGSRTEIREVHRCSAYDLVSAALTNVAKHAQAATARVTVTRENARVVVEVADDGVGEAAQA